MTARDWDEAPITKQHDRAGFDCGESELNLYLQKFARQNHESGGAKCFVAVPAATPARILGFYTLSPASLEYSRTPALAKKASADTTYRCSASAALPSIPPGKAAGWAARFCSAPPRAASVSRKMSVVWRC